MAAPVSPEEKKVYPALYGPVFRKIPWRYVGYAYTVYEVVCWDPKEDRPKRRLRMPPIRHCHMSGMTWWRREEPAPDVQNEDDYSDDLWSVTLTYVCFHSVYRLAVSFVEASNPELVCPFPNIFLFPCVALAETLVWDALATIAGPYLMACLTHFLLHNVALKGLPSDNPFKKYGPRAGAVASVLLFGPLLDRASDNIVMKTMNRYSVCNSPDFAPTYY